MLELDIYKKLSQIELDVSFSIKEHEFIALSGKSGSGKTTLLRIIAGLESARGEITVFGKSWLSEKRSMPTQNRGIGFLFQDYGLFENMSVEQNLLYVSKDRELSSYLLEMTELSEFRSVLPRALSGGQKQRVALCRALMRRPKLLLLDEPLSALDLNMRKKLQQDILNFHDKFGTTTIMVSHDTHEIYRLASRIIILEDGKVIAEENPKDLLLEEIENLTKEAKALIQL